MLVSFVIPAFNVARYLPRCLTSILSQSVSTDDYEVIVVDDGSTDDTSAVVREWAERYPNLKLIQQQHAGVSIARNAGLQVVQGDYILFSDADDVVDADVFPALFDHLQKSTTQVTFLRSFYGQTEHYAWSTHFKEGYVYTARELICGGYVRGSVCGAAYRRGFIMKHRIRFIPHVDYCEDYQFNMEMLFHGHSFDFKSLHFYRVIGRENSTTRRYTPERIDSQIACMSIVYDHIDNLQSEEGNAFVIPYMYYAPIGNLVVATLRTPQRTLRHLLKGGVERFCHKVVPARGIDFQRNKMRLMHFSFTLYYLLVKLKQWL